MSEGKGVNHYSPEKQREGGGGFGQFLYNSETGQVLGRTGMSWLKITVFYIIFFIGLALFFGLMYFVFYSFLDLEKPRWVGENGLIGGNPGVGFRPTPDQDKYPESTLIWINAKDEADNSSWANGVAGFLKDYKKTLAPEAMGMDCTFDNELKANDTHFCKVNVTAPYALGGCGEDDNYGYRGSSLAPCIVIKLNKIFGWNPDSYTVDTLKDAEKKEMPKDLQERIRTLSASPDPIKKRELKTVWISCEGESPADKESIGKLVYYSPNFREFPGIPNYYFPYENQKGYLSPFVMVKFMNPRPNTLIQVECKGWATNIAADRQLRLGSTHFELMVDKVPEKAMGDTPVES